MIKKIFVIIPILIFFTACSNKNQNIESNNSQSEKTTLTYIEYKKLYEEKNKKIKNKPILEYETVITPKEYKTLMLNENSENVKSSSEIPKRKQAFNDFYNEWKNVRYKLGGESKKGIDCSAFTQRIYKDKFGIKLPRTTLTQVNMGVEVKKAELIPGDLVFFKTSKTDKHVGVYVGNGNFMHASIKGIQFTSLDKPFYKKNYWTSRRIID
ncbi:MAG: NlpC/P60 family protein [Arcobacter sp.]|uniref:Outer membrane lipoprotein, NlpC/P60 family n=1 Tax=Arcobacter defluvii TaxID=873191 RepID=A0AAE7BHI1_9BACT|nr:MULTISPECIES: NlpC/P60 family protein [Arcobacter]QKF78693.1 outer membrane lipoprotein, NlpC/P60 family [Arcobacter defluvii]BAK74470.1 putative lipoprotein [Arcobacter sp. L]